MNPRVGSLRAAPLVALLACAGACAPPAKPASAPTAAPACVSIVSWNDLHGQLEADHPAIDTGVVPAGGVIALADAVADVRASGDAVVVLDAGDLFTGPLESSLAEGAPVVAAYDAIGVDAAALGNHEFDFGPAGFARVTAAPGVGDEAGADGPRGALLARMAEARFLFLSANVQQKGGRAVAWPRLARSARFSRGGFDVGVVGYTTRDTPTTSIRPNVDDLDFEHDAGPRVAAEIRALRAAGAAPIVLLAHASLEGELPQSLESTGAEPAGTGEIARLLDALGADRPDLVIGGHRHAWMLGRVRGVPMVTTDQHGVGVARSRFCRATAASAPALRSIERRVTLASFPPASSLGREVERVVAPALEAVRAQASVVVATVPRPCAAQAPDGTALAEQIAGAIAAHAADALAVPRGVAVVGLMNAGGIRAPLAAGAVRYADLFAVSPFENQVAVCGTTRGGLAQVLRRALARPSARERFPFGVAGATLTLARGAGGAWTLGAVALDGEKAGAHRDDEPVWLALPDFLLFGGDGLLEGVTCSPHAVAQVRVREALREALARDAACDGAPKHLRISASSIGD